MRIGIMGAMHEEVHLLTEALQNHECINFEGGGKYHIGQLNEQDVVVVFSGWGKVASAATATILIVKFDVDLIIFTGVAGGIGESLNRGDVVIASELYQHDMDATPLCKKHEIPGMNQIYFSVEDELKLRAHTAAERFLSHAADLPSFAMSLRQFGITAPKVLMGKIGSGDKFISDEASRNALLVDEPDLQAVDMESAAVAQVCGRHNRKCVVIRTISDSANTHAPMDFTVFIASIAAHYSHGIVSDFLKEQTQPAVGR